MPVKFTTTVSKIMLKELLHFPSAQLRKTVAIEWMEVFLTFIHTRFLNNGNNTWALNKHGKHALRQTLTLLNAVNPKLEHPPGSRREIKDLTLVVGYGGPSLHPTRKTARIADIVEFHSTGRFNMPVRKIMVPPPYEIQIKMLKIGSQRYQEELNKRLEDGNRTT